MQVTVLGCSGGIGGEARTTSLLIDDDILIDAGTGITDLDLAAMAAIDHVFLTHSHLDHLAALPLMMDSVGQGRGHPLVVHAQAATIQALRTHMFNGQIWPDFSQVPEGNPYMVFEELPPGAEADIGGRLIRSIPVEHTVPAVGYLVGDGGGRLAFSGDTTQCDHFWAVLNDTADLRYLLIETTFLDAQIELCRIAKHLCPVMLAEELDKLRLTPQIFITHLMPGEEAAIMAEIAGYLPVHTPQPLQKGQIFSL